MKCIKCNKDGFYRQLFYVDWYGNKIYTEELECYCDICWRDYCLCAD